MAARSLTDAVHPGHGFDWHSVFRGGNWRQIVKGGLIAAAIWALVLLGLWYYQERKEAEEELRAAIKETASVAQRAITETASLGIEVDLASAEAETAEAKARNAYRLLMSGVEVEISRCRSVEGEAQTARRLICEIQILRATQNPVAPEVP